MFKAVCSSQPVSGSVPRTLREPQRSRLHLRQLRLPPAALAAPGCISELRSALVYRALTQPPLSPSSRPLSHFFKIKFGRSKAARPAPAGRAAPRRPRRFQRLRARVSSSGRAGGGRLQRPGPLANMVLAAPERRPPCLPCTCLSSRSYSQVSAGPGRPLPSPVYSQFVGRLRSQLGSAAASRVYCLERARPTPRLRGPRHPRGCLQRMGF